MRADVLSRVATIRKAVAIVEEHSPETVRAHMEKVENRMEYDPSYRHTLGWNDTQVSGCTFTIPETYKGYPITAMRFTFNSETGTPTGDVTITKVVS